MVKKSLLPLLPLLVLMLTVGMLSSPTAPVFTHWPKKSVLTLATIYSSAKGALFDQVGKSMFLTHAPR